MITWDDKRDFIRMQVEAPIQIKLMDSQQDVEIDGVCHDLSATGLSFTTEREIKKGTEIEITIAAGSALPPLEAAARVVRSEPAEGSHWSLGAEILSIK